MLIESADLLINSGALSLLVRVHRRQASCRDLCHRCHKHNLRYRLRDCPFKLCLQQWYLQRALCHHPTLPSLGFARTVLTCALLSSDDCKS